MVEFLPCKDQPLIRALCEKAGVEYDTGVFAYTAEENGKHAGFGLFFLDEERVEVLYVPEDAYLADVLTRSGMNYAQQKGIALVNFKRANSQAVFKQLGFVKEDDSGDEMIASYLRSCKKDKD